MLRPVHGLQGDDLERFTIFFRPLAFIEAIDDAAFVKRDDQRVRLMFDAIDEHNFWLVLDRKFSLEGSHVPRRFACDCRATLSRLNMRQ